MSEVLPVFVPVVACPELDPEAESVECPLAVPVVAPSVGPPV
jgi:hypothetical protein